LIGWKLSYVEQLLILAKNVPVHFWLHDFSQFALTTNCYGTIENIATLLNLVAMPANYVYMAAFDLCITRLSVAYSNGFQFK